MTQFNSFAMPFLAASIILLLCQAELVQNAPTRLGGLGHSTILNPRKREVSALESSAQGMASYPRRALQSEAGMLGLQLVRRYRGTPEESVISRILKTPTELVQAILPRASLGGQLTSPIASLQAGGDIVPPATGGTTSSGGSGQNKNASNSAAQNQGTPQRNASQQTSSLPDTLSSGGENGGTTSGSSGGNSSGTSGGNSNDDNTAGNGGTNRSNTASGNGNSGGNNGGNNGGGNNSNSGSGNNGSGNNGSGNNDGGSNGGGNTGGSNTGGGNNGGSNNGGGSNGMGYNYSGPNGNGGSYNNGGNGNGGWTGGYGRDRAGVGGKNGNPSFGAGEYGAGNAYDNGGAGIGDYGSGMLRNGGYSSAATGPYQNYGDNGMWNSIPGGYNAQKGNMGGWHSTGISPVNQNQDRQGFPTWGAQDAVPRNGDMMYDDRRLNNGGAQYGYTGNMGISAASGGNEGQQNNRETGRLYGNECSGLGGTNCHLAGTSPQGSLNSRETGGSTMGCQGNDIGCLYSTASVHGSNGQGCLCNDSSQQPCAGANTNAVLTNAKPVASTTGCASGKSFDEGGSGGGSQKPVTLRECSS